MTRGPLPLPSGDRLPHLAAAMAVLAGCVWPVSAHAADTGARVDVQLAVEQSTGRYDEDHATRIRQTSLTLRWRNETWLAELQWPWLEVRSGGVAGGLPGSVGGGGSVERGQGDAWAKLSWSVPGLDAESLSIDLTARLKLSSGAVDRGLGSGGTDLAWQVEVVRPAGPVQWFGHLGHRRTGDVAGHTPYRDPWYLQVGLSHRPDAALELGALVDAREPIGRLGRLLEATGYLAWRGGSQRWQLHLTRGLAPASPDWAIGLTARQRF